MTCDKQERLAAIGNNLTPNQINDLEEAIKVFPAFDVKVEVFVEGFDEIVVNDLVSIKITLNRLNKEFEDDKEVGLSHSNTNIDLFEEKIAVLFTKNDRILYETLVRTFIYIIQSYYYYI